VIFIGVITDELLKRRKLNREVRDTAAANAV